MRKPVPRNDEEFVTVVAVANRLRVTLERERGGVVRTELYTPMRKNRPPGREAARFRDLPRRRRG